MVEARSLRRAIVPPSLIPNPSPANLQSTRLALHVNDGGSSLSVYIGSGCRVYKIERLLGKVGGSSVMGYMGDATYVVRVMHDLEEMQDIYGRGHGYQGEGELVDSYSCTVIAPMKVMKSSVVDRCPHRSEIQSVVLAGGGGDNCLIMGTVDSYGHLIVTRLDVIGSDVDRLSYSVLPRDCGVGEGSWAGVCFSPINWSTAAVARSFCRSIDVYDQDIHLRSLHTLWYPASISFLENSPSGDGSSSILGVAEGSQLTIWDLRTNHNGGCIQRVCGAIGDLIYSVCSSPSGVIAVGGSDRTVTIYDPRRWSALSRWVNCSKYEITGLSFSSIDPAYIYIQGVDYEVLCGGWKENRKVFSFRGDSNWLGFSKCANMDVLAGWCESGSIFVTDVVQEQQESHLISLDI